MAKKPKAKPEGLSGLREQLDAMQARVEYRGILRDRLECATVRIAEGTWTSEQRNSALCGHLLNAWAIIIGLLALFFGVGKPSYAVMAVAFSLVSLTCVWLLAASGPYRKSVEWISITAQITGYGALALWAARLVP